MKNLKKINYILFYPTVFVIICLLFVVCCKDVEDISQTNSSKIIAHSNNPNSNLDDTKELTVGFSDASVIENRKPFKRRYHIYFPKGFDKTKKYPVIILLHGVSGTGSSIGDRMKDKTYERGYILIAPDGYSQSWNAGNCCLKARLDKVDDVGFIKIIIDREIKNKWVNSDRIYLSGFSNGGMMTYRSLCSLSSRIRAIGVVSGNLEIPKESCNLSKVVPIIHIHSGKDEIVPYNGSSIAPKSPPVESTLNFFAEEYKLSERKIVTENESFFNHYFWTNSNGKAIISHFKLFYRDTSSANGSLGHFWPSRRSGKIDASTEIINFFSVH